MIRYLYINQSVDGALRWSARRPLSPWRGLSSTSICQANVMARHVDQAWYGDGLADRREVFL